MDKRKPLCVWDVRGSLKSIIFFVVYHNTTYAFKWGVLFLFLYVALIQILIPYLYLGHYQL